MIIITGTGDLVNTLQRLIILIFLAVLITACHHKPAELSTASNIPGKIPVEFVHPEIKAIKNYLTLNGVSSYLKEEIIRSTVTGYVQDIKKKIGDTVSPGQVLFLVKTKESAALQGFTEKITDSNDLRFNGVIPVKAHQSGIIRNIDFNTGSYIHEGDILATILQPETIVLQINVPYEYHQYVKIGEQCQLIFPGHMIKTGHISKILPTVDPVTQTQKYFVTLNHYEILPENLKVVVKLPVIESKKAIVLPKKAILSNETETSFWIMKIVHDSLAIKVPVLPGIVSGDTIEIISPRLSVKDTIITKGNYGLDDSTFVMITNK